MKIKHIIYITMEELKQLKTVEYPEKREPNTLYYRINGYGVVKLNDLKNIKVKNFHNKIILNQFCMNFGKQNHIRLEFIII